MRHLLGYGFLYLSTLSHGISPHLKAIGDFLRSNDMVFSRNVVLKKRELMRGSSGKFDKFPH